MKRQLTEKNRAALRRAIGIIGSQVELARAIGIGKGNVNDWVHERSWLSYDSAYKVESATKGKVTAKQLLSK